MLTHEQLAEELGRDSHGARWPEASGQRSSSDIIGRREEGSPPRPAVRGARPSRGGSRADGCILVD